MWNRNMFLGCLLCFSLTHSALLAGVEITALSGYGVGGEFEEHLSGGKLKVSDTSLYGAAINFDAGQETNAQIELYFTRQETRLTGGNLASQNSAFNLTIDYYHIGGMLMSGASDSKFKPFIVGTIGATHMNPVPSSYSSHTAPSLGLGGGVKYFVTKHIGLRAEARAIGTLVDGSAVAFVGPGGSRVYIQGDLFLQFHFNAGLILRF
jgi:opacity protein-like surface antigen